ncbi:PrpF protein-domain-containing protein [Aspergillus lucknowensis]|uniref:PrpF protein-domain-containing protein n=1 Tax=Aspergillus lucknowensis TaxID=176173 RepID=A0ABR4LD48_9EURO
MSDDWVERGLVAEAAKQRQMEQLNFVQNKLDFDGVDPDLGMHLLSLHWNRQHHSFLITYRPAFMRDMACNGPYFSKLLLNAIYFGAAKFSPRLEVRKDPNDVRTAGWKYRERVRELLGGALDCSDITTIQALLVMTNSLFALGDERSAAWLYAGLAFRMLTDLGMHVDLTSTHRFSDEDLEIRRRIFWGAFVVDKIQSLYQGRPVSLKETDALVPIKFLDTYEELEHWMPFAYSTSAPDYPGTPAYSTSTFTFLCKLSLIMSDILNCIYTERSFDQSPTDLANMLDRVQLRLDQWQASLPEHLRFDPGRSHTLAFPPPHVSSLHAMFNVLVILLHRPFVADGHLYSTSRTISVDCFKKCASAAANISSLLRGYHRAFSIRRAPYLISYATYVAATILTRIAARRRNDSMAHANLATCLAVFEENQETNSAVRKAAMIIHNLMKKLGVVIDNLSIDALGPGLQGRSSDQEQPHHAPVDGNIIYLTNSQNAAGNTNATGAATEPANITSPTQVVYSPDSDWVDIDGIIQSFLQENGGRGTRLAESDIEGISSHIPRTPLIPLQGVAHLPGDMDNAPFVGHQASPSRDISATNGFHRAEAVPGIYQWQHGWRFISGESASLDDPLFGFNGSSLDSLTLAECLWPNPSTMVAEQVFMQRRPKRHVLPCVLMRAGTSKGIFLHRQDLPTSELDWAPHLISALGSRGNDPRQIDGVGGGTSTTSKVAVVSRSQRPDADIDWTFVQVAVGKESVDLTGNCGNMTAGVAPFAVQEGLVQTQPGQTQMDVRIYNTNTDRIVIETVALDASGDYEEAGDYTIPGVSNPGSEVKCTFVEPIGSMTGRLFPSNDQQQQILQVHSHDRSPFSVRVTLIDSANPFVLIDASSIKALLQSSHSDSAQNNLVESIRREAAVAMGLASNVEVAAQTRGTPKAALVYRPTADPIRAPLTPEHTPPPDEEIGEKVFGSERKVRIAHSKGVINVNVVMGNDERVVSCAVSRTARRLFEGRIRYYV